MKRKAPEQKRVSSTTVRLKPPQIFEVRPCLVDEGRARASPVVMTRSEQAARVPRENSSSGNSDQTWMGGRRGLVHAGRGQECRSAYAMGDRTKHEDFSPGLQRHHAQKVGTIVEGTENV